MNSANLSSDIFRCLHKLGIPLNSQACTDDFEFLSVKFILILKSLLNSQVLNSAEFLKVRNFAEVSHLRNSTEFSIAEFSTVEFR
jgi:hypothetical protein